MHPLDGFYLIKEIITFGTNMTMNCPLCGTLMVWLNGSIMHDPPVNHYQCRNDNIYVTKFQDGTYEIQYPKKNNKNSISSKVIQNINISAMVWHVLKMTIFRTKVVVTHITKNGIILSLLTASSTRVEDISMNNY